MTVDDAIALLTSAKVYDPHYNFCLDRSKLATYIKSNSHLSIQEFVNQAATWKIVPVHGFGDKRLSITAASWLYHNGLRTKSRFLKAYRSNPKLLDGVSEYIRTELLGLLLCELPDTGVVGYLVIDQKTGDYVKDSHGRPCLYPKSMVDTSIAIPVIRAKSWR